MLKDNRKTPRETVGIEVDASLDGAEFSILLRDLSREGCLVETRGGGLRQGAAIVLHLPSAGWTSGTVLWARDHAGGVEFHEPIHDAVVKHLGFRNVTDSGLDFKDRFDRRITRRTKPFDL